MKRSEMVEKIVKIIDKHTIVYGDRFIAEKILQVMEEYGMKPPLTKKCPVLLTDNHVWEDECKQ